jgi:hypothetical protein
LGQYGAQASSLNAAQRPLDFPINSSAASFKQQELGNFASVRSEWGWNRPQGPSN